MTDTYRALCAELTDELQGYASANPYHDSDELIDRARAALAQLELPANGEVAELVMPSYEELDEFAMFWWGADTDERMVTDVIESGSMSAYARVVLARWGKS